MKYWIVPSNESTFRIGDAIKAQGGMADWRTDRFSVGDTVFIYKTKPELCVRYRMEVIKTKIIFDEALEQEPFWTDKDTYYQGIVSYYARLKLTEEYTDDILSLHHLHEHGYQGDPQSVREVKDKELLEFLLHPHQLVNEDVYDVDYPEDDEALYEGALMTVKANRYERNQRARRECVALKGYKCLVCGKDFEASYGEIGKGFIHVHHLTPIASIGKEYQLDVANDLVPVCPNCHYMLHRKNPPYTIEELKAIIDQKKSTDGVPAGKRQKKPAREWRFVSPLTMVTDVNDDEELRRLIHNLMEIDGGTMMRNITSVCIKQFQERYAGMQPNDWRHLIDDYVRTVTGNPELQEDEIFYWKAG